MAIPEIPKGIARQITETRLEEFAKAKGLDGPEQIPAHLETEAKEYVTAGLLEWARIQKSDGTARGAESRKKHMPRVAHGVPLHGNMLGADGLAAKILKTPGVEKSSIGTVGDVSVTVALCSMTDLPVESVVAPHWPGNGESSFGGVGAAIRRAGGSAAFDAYDAHCEEHEANFRDVTITESGTRPWTKVLHAVSVSSGADEEFQVVHDTAYNVLKSAADAGIKSVAFPALGTGIIGKLEAAQSAQAIMSAIERASQDGIDVPEVAIAIFGDEPAYSIFASTLEQGSYGEVAPQRGRRVFDPDRWMTEMVQDHVLRIGQDEDESAARIAPEAPEASDSGGAFPILSAGRGTTRTGAGTELRYPSEFPESDTRYAIVRADQTQEAADALTEHVSRFYKSPVTPDGRLPVDVYEIEVNGHRIAMLASGDPEFYFGIGESDALRSVGAHMGGFHMRDLDAENLGFFAGKREHLEESAAKLYGAA